MINDPRVVFPPLGWVPPGSNRRQATSFQIQTETVSKALDAARLEILNGISKPIENKPVNDTEWQVDPKLLQLDRTTRIRLVVADLLTRIQIRFSGTPGHPNANAELLIGNSTLMTIERPNIKELGFRASGGGGGLDDLVDLMSPALRGDKLNQILVQSEEIFPFFAAVLDLRPDRYPIILELVEAVAEATDTIVQRIKFHLNVPRPVELSPQVHPAIITPSTASYPAGHAAVGFAVSSFLGSFFTKNNDVRELLNVIAQSISDAREAAGLHFRVDSEKGKEIGEKIGAFLYFAALKLDGEAIKKLDKKTKDVYATLTSANSLFTKLAGIAEQRELS